MKPKIIAIVGPTATGKSSLAINLAKKFKGEIISADSRQIYRGLNLGTGKVTQKEMEGVPHHLLDISSPKRVVSVTEYSSKAKTALQKILQNKKVSILCGGTGFYVDTFLFERNYPEVAPNAKLRKQFEKQSTKTLYKRLQKLDPRRAKEIDKHNKVRLIRALEIISALGAVPKIQTSSPYDTLFIGLTTDEKTLKNKIKDRLEERLKKGMIREARALHGQSLSYKRMEALGLEYKYLSLFLQKKISKKEMIDQLGAAIWQYSKKQMTWFKRNKAIIWLDPKKKSTRKQAEKLVKEFLA